MPYTVSVLKSGLLDIRAIDVDVRVQHLRWLMRDLATTDIRVIELQVHVCTCVLGRERRKGNDD